MFHLCHLISLNPYLLCVARATIEVPPRDTTVNVTDDATFSCGVAGIPLPFVTWTLPDGRDLEPLDPQTEVPPRIFTVIDISEETPYEATSRLFIVSASPEDVGEYTCTAANEHDSVSASAILTVQG